MMDFFQFMALAFVGLVCMVFLSILSQDCAAWLERGAASLVRRAAQKLPEPNRSRYCEEWLADLADTPGTIGKLFFAMSVRSAAGKLQSQQQAVLSEIDLKINSDANSKISAPKQMPTRNNLRPKIFVSMRHALVRLLHRFAKHIDQAVSSYAVTSRIVSQRALLKYLMLIEILVRRIKK